MFATNLNKWHFNIGVASVVDTDDADEKFSGNNSSVSITDDDDDDIGDNINKKSSQQIKGYRNKSFANFFCNRLQAELSFSQFISGFNSP